MNQTELNQVLLTSLSDEGEINAAIAARGAIEPFDGPARERILAWLTVALTDPAGLADQARSQRK